MEGFWIDGFTDLIVRAVRGENMFTHPRFPLSVAPAVASMANQAASHEAAFEAKLEAWLKQRKNTGWARGVEGVTGVTVRELDRSARQ